MTPTKDATNPWFGISMALIGVIVGYGIAMAMGTTGSAPAQPSDKPTAAAPSAPTPAPAAPTVDNAEPVDADNDYIRGNPDATISIIEYSDFECPFCGRVHDTLKQVIEEDSDINWVYRHYPLGFHPNAQPSAEGAECVGELVGNDAFWAFSDLIFERGANKDSLAGYAEEVGADKAAFEECLNSGKYAQKVKDQMAAGSAAGVRGTPGNIVINNKTGKAELVSGAQGKDAFLAAAGRLK